MLKFKQAARPTNLIKQELFLLFLVKIIKLKELTLELSYYNVYAIKALHNKNMFTSKNTLILYLHIVSTVSYTQIQKLYDSRSYYSSLQLYTFLKKQITKLAYADYKDTLLSSKINKRLKRKAYKKKIRLVRYNTNYVRPMHLLSTKRKTKYRYAALKLFTNNKIKKRRFIKYKNTALPRAKELELRLFKRHAQTRFYALNKILYAEGEDSNTEMTVGMRQKHKRFRSINITQNIYSKYRLLLTNS